jgi:hypothetical protein
LLPPTPKVREGHQLRHQLRHQPRGRPQLRVLVRKRLQPKHPLKAKPPPRKARRQQKEKEQEQERVKEKHQQVVPGRLQRPVVRVQEKEVQEVQEERDLMMRRKNSSRRPEQDGRKRSMAPMAPRSRESFAIKVRTHSGRTPRSTGRVSSPGRRRLMRRSPLN